MNFFKKLLGSADDKNVSTEMFNRFTEIFPPSAELTKPTAEMLSWYKDKLPAPLLAFWQEYGFGNYGNGLIKVVEPSDYMDSLYAWLGKEDFSRLPVLVSAFGDIFYYRQLAEGKEDISLLDIHYREISVCTYSLNEFFENFITDEGIINDMLRKPLFDEAIGKSGQLNSEEIFYFEPALIVGGEEHINYIGKGTGSVHQQLLLQMGQ